MNINDFSAGIRGSHQGLIVGQDERVDELNERLQGRHFPDRALQPNFAPRSTSTKYARFPIIERRSVPVIPIQSGAPFDIKTNFNPATNRGPVGAYLANIDTETVLRGHYTALQHGNDQGVYVPSSTSNMYTGMQAVGRQETQTHPGLFSRHEFSTTVSPVVSQIGQDLFSNNTRVQLRGI
jgi:hypothetical protein